MPDTFADDKFVTVFGSRSHLAEVESEMICGLLKSAGLRAMIVRENVPQYPTGKIVVRVLESQLEEAQALIEEAQRGGADASSEPGETA